MTDELLSADENRSISAAIREELAKLRLTRQHLADKAKISLSTLEKGLAGQRPFTLATVVRLEEALGHSLRKPRMSFHQDMAVAPDALGNYARPAVKWLEGRYVTIRASFSNPASLYTYMTEIHWDSTLSHLAYRESERIDADFKHDGAVSVPHQSGYIYLVTNRHGQYRLAILSRPTIAGEMYGLLTTLQLGRGSQLTPVSTPIVLVPIQALGEDVAFGRIDASMAAHARYLALLRRAVDDPFVLMVQAEV
ncbi:MAG: helix-turn-helix transcriptional regulator [Proteobacteria bacterium]|nr:helix-turn-helix transcriptional regulator [Pseudomonadota bacterium]